MKTKPLSSNVLIKIEKADEKTKSGIVLISEQDKKLEKAEVIEVGKDVKLVKKGDTILFKSYSPDTINIDDEELSFIKEEEILAKIL